MSHSDAENAKSYKQIGRVYCPYFKEYVSFTKVGLEHLRFKNRYTARSEKDRLMRFRLLPVAIDILSRSHTLQGKDQRRRFEDRFIHNRKEYALTEVTYYEFIAIIDALRVKVVLKQIESSEKTFLSVIPLFKQKMPLIESDIL